ncbi:MAG: hypothetical protein LKJ69_05965 [Lactobacillus sp.]|nr:hypothetical protein [Lactobacillus sp.]MCI2032933.1 hypothetical protein [Lactobacillus sp.]
MTQFLVTVGTSLMVLVLSSIGLSWLNGATIRLVVRRTGKSNSELLVMKPGIFVHEALHAIVGWLFGLRITRFSLRPDIGAQTAAHVEFAYDRRSLRQRLGVLFSSGAPLWGIGVLVMLLGKRAWFASVAWAAIAPATVQPDWPWVGIWFVVTVLLTFGASLSRQDLKNFWIGLPFLGLILSGGYGLLLWFAPEKLSTWGRLNGLAILSVCVMAGIALVVNRIVALTTRL